MLSSSSSTLDAVVLVDDRPLAALEPADARVGVHADDQQVALRLGELEVLHVAEVDQVEAAVGEDDPLAAARWRCELGEQLVERALLAEVLVLLGEQFRA